MNDSIETYFEISDAGNSLKIEVLEYCKYNNVIDWDRNWVKAKVSIKSGAFLGDYIADFMTLDFKEFRKQLSYLYDNLAASTSFNDLEGYLDLKIKGDGIGHFELNGIACDAPGVFGSTLNFTLYFDQTNLQGFVKMLDTINQQFPVIGNFKA
jgi:hypothetical protein